MTIMAKNPKDYDLEDVTPDAPEQFDVVKVSAATNLTLVADLADHPQAELQGMNPSLLRNVAPAGFELRIPQGASPALMAGLEKVPADKRGSWRGPKGTHGDSPGSIPRRYGNTPPKLSPLNRAGEGGVPGEPWVWP